MHVLFAKSGQRLAFEGNGEAPAPNKTTILYRKKAAACSLVSRPLLY